jgi:hypothetical protein
VAENRNFHDSVRDLTRTPAVFHRVKVSPAKSLPWRAMASVSPLSNRKIAFKIIAAAMQQMPPMPFLR